MVDQNYFFRRRPCLANKNVTFAKLSRTPRLSFAGPMLGNKKIRSPPAKLRQRITDHFLIAFLNMQLASRNPLSGQVVADQFFLQGLLTHPLQHALWLPPAPSQTFRGTFAKITLFTGPGHQQKARWRKSEHQGPWCLALAKPHCWKLGCCIWSLFLET